MAQQGKAAPRHHRQSLRLPGYDYAQPGAYFVTLCTWQRANLFGEIVNGQMQLNDWGQIVAQGWVWLAEQYPYVELDEWVVMPNHLHGIIVINAGRGGSRPAPTPAYPALTPMRPAPTNPTTPAPADLPKRKPLGQLIGAFKTVAAKRINLLRGAATPPVWQRNYYEHIVRNDRELAAIQRYIQNNPAQWALDRDNTANGRPEAVAADEYVRGVEA